jgi:hypothetical protein
MFLAVVSVSLLIALALGLRRHSSSDRRFGHARPDAVRVLGCDARRNRITLFALIFSIGILVDDAIVVVENIVRHAR